MTLPFIKISDIYWVLILLQEFPDLLNLVFVTMLCSWYTIHFIHVINEEIEEQDWGTKKEQDWGTKKKVT